MPTMSRSFRSRNSIPSSDVSSPPKTRCSNCFGGVDLLLIAGIPSSKVGERHLLPQEMGDRKLTGRRPPRNLGDRNGPPGYGEFTLSLKLAGSRMWHSGGMVAPDGCSEA